jgi:anti-sigma factor RsiW
MEKMTSRDDQLLNYLDGRLDGPHARKLEEQLQSSPPLRARLEELRVIHNALTATAHMEVPSRNFTERVMNRLDSFPAISGLSPKNGILLFSGILVAVAVALMLLRAGTFDAFHGAVTLDALPLQKNWIKTALPSAIQLNGKWLVNVILVIATGLSFVLLDRTILRPIFERRSGIHY